MFISRVILRYIQKRAGITIDKKKNGCVKYKEYYFSTLNISERLHCVLQRYTNDFCFSEISQFLLHNNIVRIYNIFHNNKSEMFYSIGSNSIKVVAATKH